MKSFLILKIGHSPTSKYPAVADQGGPGGGLLCDIKQKGESLWWNVNYRL